MILDILDNASRYYGLGRGFAAALKYLESGAWQGLAVGQYDVEPGLFSVRVQEYTTLPIEQGRWEAHKLYSDLQFVVSGVERMGYGSLDRFAATEAYDAANDVYFPAGDGDIVTVRAGAFAIFTPEDVHMPRLAAVEGPAPVRKLVLKVPESAR